MKNSRSYRQNKKDYFRGGEWRYRLRRIGQGGIRLEDMLLTVQTTSTGTFISGIVWYSGFSDDTSMANEYFDVDQQGRV